MASMMALTSGVKPSFRMTACFRINRKLSHGSQLAGQRVLQSLSFSSRAYPPSRSRLLSKLDSSSSQSSKPPGQLELSQFLQKRQLRTTSICLLKVEPGPTPAPVENGYEITPPTAGEQQQQQQRQQQQQDSNPPKPDLKQRMKNMKWYWKWLIVFGELCIVDYLFDRYVLGGFSLRTTIAYTTLLRIGLDYKMHYGSECWLSQHRAQDLHKRNADRLLWMLQYNGGLYLKSGQALAMQGAILPVEYQELFAKMFDNAEAASWKEMEKVVKEEFGGRSIEEVFGALDVNATEHTAPNAGDVVTSPNFVFEETPRACASIAQVHYARLADGQPVAVKIQKRAIAKSVSWDLWSMEKLADYCEWVTGLPLSESGKYIAEQIMNEVDFNNEANNAERLRELIDGDKDLRERAYVPRVFRQLSSKRVLTTEWIEGATLWDKENITGKAASRPVSPASSLKGSKPVQSKQGLGLSLDDVMGTVIELWNKQIFHWGFVHCDPHPGNILVRQRPSSPSRAQVVLLDFGLCIDLPDLVRRQYGRFWHALVMADDVGLQQVAQEWGLESADAWADASLLRPYKEKTGVDENGVDAAMAAAEAKEKKKKETSEERSQRMIAESKAYLGKEGLFPMEMFLLERTLTILQGNNRYLGSPVNRIKLIGLGAARAVQRDERRDPSLRQQDVSVIYGLRRAIFARVALASLDMAYWWSWLRQRLGYGSGFEEELKEAEDRQMDETKDVIAELFGITME